MKRKFSVLSKEYFYRQPLFSTTKLSKLSLFLLKQRKEEKDREAKAKENQVWFYHNFFFMVKF